MKYHLDYLQISLNINRKAYPIKRLREINTILERISQPISKGNSKLFEKNNLPNADSLFHYINVNHDIRKNSIFINHNKKYFSIAIHFKGSFFKTAKGFKKDLLEAKTIYGPLKHYFNEIMVKYFGFIPEYTITVSRIDIMCNHFDKNFGITSDKASEPTIIGHGSINDINVWINKSDMKMTGISMGVKTNPYLFFRSYDKRYMDLESRTICKARFNTDELIRNEWQIRTQYLRTNSFCSIYNIEDLEQMIFQEEIMASFIKHIRKGRDVIPKDNRSNPYRSVHIEEADHETIQIFKRKLAITEARKVYYYNPYKQIKGILNNHIDKMTEKDLKRIIFRISDYQKSKAIC